MGIPPFLKYPFLYDFGRLEIDQKCGFYFQKCPFFKMPLFSKKGHCRFRCMIFTLCGVLGKCPFSWKMYLLAKNAPFVDLGSIMPLFCSKMWLFCGKCPFLEILLCYDLRSKIIHGIPKMWLFLVKCPFLKKWGFWSKKPLLGSQKCGFLFKNVAF